MSDYLPFAIVGLTAGAVYGLVATGLVMTYRTSGLFNFGHGAIAAAGAYAFYWLNVERGLPWGLTMVLVVGVLGPALGLAVEPIARRLAQASTTYKVVGTVGLILIVQGLATIRYGTGLIAQPQYLPESTVSVMGTLVSWSQIIVMLVGLAVVGSLYVFFRSTRMGVAMRAVVDDAELLDLTGTSPVLVRRVSWILGSMMAVLAGALIAPNSNLDAVVLTFLIVQAFGAAAIGAFSSIPLAYAGGSIVGIAAALATKWSTNEWLRGFPAVVPFAVLLLVLLLPKRRLATETGAKPRPKRVWRAPARVRATAGVLVVGALAVVPMFVGYRVNSYTTALIQAMLLLSLGLLVRTSGQVSLCQMAFAAVGAVAFYQLRVEHGLPWLVALIGAGFVAVPIGALVAIPAIRLSGLYLALATLGFGVAMQYMFYPLNFMFSIGEATRPMPHPSWGASDRGFYYVVLGAVVVTGILVVAINQGRLGRMLRGMADSPVAISTLGLDLRVTRVLVFCISSFIAAIAGALLGVLLTTASPESFPAFDSLVLVAVLAVAPFAEPWYALAGSAGLALVPVYVHGANTTSWLNVVFGVFAIVVALQDGPHSSPALVRRLLDHLGGRRPDDEAATPADDAAPRPSLARARAEPGPGLEVASLAVRFGGLVAVDELTLSAPLGRITGLIGPNGAGKTTTFNACTGLLRPANGRIKLHGDDVTSLNPSARGRRRLGRTFQRMELFDSLTVRDNVGLGCEAPMGGSRPWAQLFARAGERDEIDLAVRSALATCGIEHLADQQAGLLSTGERRLVELARCVAGPFDVLLLDEPSSGLDRRERGRFGEILQRLVADHGVGVLLVEHDMSLVLDVCDYLYVLDFGRLIFEGDAAAVQASAVVRAAYLGDEIDELRPPAGEMLSPTGGNDDV